MTDFREAFEELMRTKDGADLRNVLFVFTVAVGVTLFIALALYLLKAIGIFTMAKSAGVPAPWLAFIPVANQFTFGAIAEKCVKRDGTKSAKFSVILLLLSVITLALTVVLSIVTAVQFARGLALLEGNHEFSIPKEVVSMMLPAVFLFFLIGGIGIAGAIVRYVALYRIFTIFNYQNAGLFTALSVLGNIFLSDILEPVFLFAVRKNEPVFDYKERLNQFTLNQGTP